MEPYPVNHPPHPKPQMEKEPSPWLVIRRIVHFGETDAAEVMHFHHLLRWCHEAYEDSLRAFGVPGDQVFANPEAALPIIYCQAHYHRPLHCGDSLVIRLDCPQLDATGFEIHYGFTSHQKVVATGVTRHRCIHPTTRQRQGLPESIVGWLEAVSLSKIPSARH